MFIEKVESCVSSLNFQRDIVSNAASGSYDLSSVLSLQTWSVLPGDFVLEALVHQESTGKNFSYLYIDIFTNVWALAMGQEVYLFIGCWVITKDYDFWKYASSNWWHIPWRQWEICLVLFSFSFQRKHCILNSLSKCSVIRETTVPHELVCNCLYLIHFLRK